MTLYILTHLFLFFIALHLKEYLRYVDIFIRCAWRNTFLLSRIITVLAGACITGAIFSQFFRLAQNVDVECQTHATEEDTEKNHFFCDLCLCGPLKLHITLCSPEKCKRIVPVLQAILAVTANLPLFKMSLGNVSFDHLFLFLISKLYNFIY